MAMHWFHAPRLTSLATAPSSRSARQTATTSSPGVSALARLGPALGPPGSPRHLGGGRLAMALRFCPLLLLGLGPVPLGTALGLALALPERVGPGPYPVLRSGVHLTSPSHRTFQCRCRHDPRQSSQGR